MIAWLHPILVNFAVGLLLASVLFDAIGLIRRDERFVFAGFCNLVAGALASIVAVVSGYVAEAKLDPHSALSASLLTFHKVFGIAVAVLSILVAGWRLALRGHIRARTTYMSLAFFAGALLFITGTIGGILVYWYGLGIPAETARKVIEMQPIRTTAPDAGLSWGDAGMSWDEPDAGSSAGDGSLGLRRDAGKRR